MILHSTNGKAPKVPFAEGVAAGVAPDGGLYMPDRLPSLPNAFFRNIAEMTLSDVAFVVCDSLFGDFLSPEAIKRLVDGAVTYPVPLRHVGGNRHLLELFHGPTGSFKDLGARFMAGLLECVAPGGNSGRNVIVATADGGGAAVADAFRNAVGARVYVLFPAGVRGEVGAAGFSRLPNVKAVAVEGSFDDCQALVREVLQPGASPAVSLTSGNSINLARELPSIIYFFHAYACAVRAAGPDAKVVVSVPCGNLGSLTAGLMAKRMGLPVHRFIAANNANDVFVEYLKTGGHRPRRSLVTMARAMDVGNPSNMARIIDLYGGDLPALRSDVEAFAYTDDEIAETMRLTRERHGIMVSPQGATALRAIDRHLAPDETGVALMGSSPDVPPVTGTEPPTRYGRVMHIPPTLGALNRVLAAGD